MKNGEVSDLPRFAFPVVAWAPELATGDPEDPGVREIFSWRDLTTIYVPTDLRRGWTFVDVDGRCWKAVSTEVTGRADPWWTQGLPRWLHNAKYRLAYDFVECPAVSFDKVKTRLFAAITANPHAYPGAYARDLRAQLRAASSLRDLIKSDEQLAIERLKPTSLWWQWLFWEGRCTRIAFLAALVGLIAMWWGLGRMGFGLPVYLTLLIISGAIVLSAVVRRLHDLKLSAWWICLWWVWSMLCALINEHGHDRGGPIIAALMWWIPNLSAFACLALWPGTRGPNRYGFAPRWGLLRQAADGGAGAAQGEGRC